ncbi:hypothetical protein NtRootA9_28920 [Arthrobacter sp. NtRootA9]|nr:hypothetical protein NtRootA9_28920 [Arthrobacter sp. NtRootA9]
MGPARKPLALALVVIALLAVLSFVRFGGEIELAIVGVLEAVVAYRAVPGKPRG